MGGAFLVGGSPNECGRSEIKWCEGALASFWSFGGNRSCRSEEIFQMRKGKEESRMERGK